MKKSKIILVMPKGGDIYQGMPLSLGYLKSNCDNNIYDIKIIDYTLEDKDANHIFNEIKEVNPDIVGVTSWSLNSPEAFAILKNVKELNSNIITLWGGPHASYSPEKLIKMKEVDFVFRGEAEISFPIFLKELNREIPDFNRVAGLVYKDENGHTHCNDMVSIKNIDDINIPDYKSIRLDKYIEKGYRYYTKEVRNAPIQVTRGCPYNCNFCITPSIFGKRVRYHSIEYMINWIQFLYRNFDVRGFNIIDDNFTFDMDYAKKFCMEIIKLGYKDIEINTHMGTRMERTDPQLYGLMKKAGWRYVVVAPESGSERVLNLMGKKLNLSIVPNIIRDIKKSGLKVHGFFMIGYPGEAEGDLLKTEMFIRQNRFNNGISVSRFQPYPGTPIFKELVERGEIPQDFLPTHYGKYNEAKYTPRELEGFDFEGFVHKLQRINDPLLTYKIMGRSLLRYPWRMYKRIFRGSSE